MSASGFGTTGDLYTEQLGPANAHDEATLRAATACVIRRCPSRWCEDVLAALGLMVERAG